MQVLLHVATMLQHVGIQAEINVHAALDPVVVHHSKDVLRRLEDRWTDRVVQLGLFVLMDAE